MWNRRHTAVRELRRCPPVRDAIDRAATSQRSIGPIRQRGVSERFSCGRRTCAGNWRPVRIGVCRERGCCRLCASRALPAGPLAQLAEQQTLNLRVEGSIPSRLTTSQVEKAQSLPHVLIVPVQGTESAAVQEPVPDPVSALSTMQGEQSADSRVARC
jgi:hypothetical protein